jgi:hypothetical protein
MTLKQKTDYVMRYVRLGMDTYSAMIVAEFTEEEIEAVEEDKRFQALMALQGKLEEKALLESFDAIMLKTIENGDSRDVRWKLGKLNPERYGDSTSRMVGGKKAKGVNIAITFDGADSSLEGADNVEVFGGDDAPRASV